MKTIRIISIISAVSMMLTSLGVKAQTATDVQYFSSTPNSILMNPANSTGTSLYVAIPVLSNIQFGFTTSGFCWKDLINEDPAKPDSLRLDLDGFSSKLKNSNSFSASYTENLLGFGFKSGKNYFGFNIAVSMDAKVSFTKDLVDLLRYGTDIPGGRTSILSDKFASMTSYVAPTLTYAREISDRLSVGASAKLYFGLANITTNKSDVNLQFDGSKTTMTSDVDISTSNAMGRFLITGLFDDNDTQEFNDNFSTKNMGFGFDFGAKYKVNDNLDMSFSVVDLGFIKWKDNAQSIRSKHPNTPVEMDGIDASYDNIGDEIDDYIDQMVDTVKYALDMESHDTAAYTTMVPTKIYIGADYRLSRFSSIQALLKGRIMDGLDASLMLDYTFRTPVFQFSVGNTFATNSLFNPNVYLTFADIFYLGVNFNSSWNVAKMSGFSFCTGVNVVIKNKKEAVSTETASLLNY